MPTTDNFFSFAGMAGCVVAFGLPFSGPYVILALLVFSLTFPGHAPRGTSPAAIVAGSYGDS